MVYTSLAYTVYALSVSYIVLPVVLIASVCIGFFGTKRYPTGISLNETLLHRPFFKKGTSLFVAGVCSTTTTANDLSGVGVSSKLTSTIYADVRNSEYCPA